jgi:tetratricopeptide (TPR) repeat protein
VPTLPTGNLAYWDRLLARVYYDQGRYAEAEALYQRTLAIDEHGLGPMHPDVAQSLNSLGGLYSIQGRDAEAEPLLQRSLAIREQALGPEHPLVAAVRKNYADVLQRRLHKAVSTTPLWQRIRACLSRTRAMH